LSLLDYEKEAYVCASHNLFGLNAAHEKIFKLFRSHRAGEFAPPAPFGYKDGRTFKVSLATINRIVPIGIEALDASWTVVLPLTERIFGADLSARHGTAVAGIEIFKRSAGRQAIFD
jgi:hypothetical protein